jgi:tRNA(fMet)-specific endonuclease VapC
MICALLEDLDLLPYERGDATATAAVRAALSKRGTSIGPYDVMIAGTALRRGLVMVTSNGG